MPKHADPERELVIDEQPKAGTEPALQLPQTDDVSLLGRVFPRTFVDVAAIAFVFAVCLIGTTAPQGLGYGRFDTRAAACYDDATYYKLQADVTANNTFCAVFSYPYRLVEPVLSSRIVPWVAYGVHQLGQWYFIRQAQLAHDRGEIQWVTQEQLGKLSGSDRALALTPNKYAKQMFALNVGMVLLKFVQSQLFYSGLASDVPEWTALGSVALWILFAMVVQMPSRGLFFGYWKNFDYECIGDTLANVLQSRDFIRFTRRYHGYGISFGTTYNFWYHPMEGSPGFVLGYLYQLCMIVQSSFLFHPNHRNKLWTLLLELGVVPHSAVIGIFFANGQSGAPFMFSFGFAFAFVTTQMHGFDLTRAQKWAFALGYFASLVLTYIIAGRSLSHVTEVFRMSMNFTFAPFAWVIWCALSLVTYPSRTLVSKYPTLAGVAWFMAFIAMIAWFVWLGPTGGR